METTSPLRREYDFVGKRRFFSGLSLVLCALSALLLFVPGPNYGIDFLGGTTIIVRFTEDVPSGDVRAAVEAMGLDGPSVQRFGGADDHEVLIETRSVTSLTPERVEALRTSVTGRFGPEATIEVDDESGDKFYVRLPLASYEYVAEGSGEPPTPAQFAENIARLEPLIAESMQVADIDGVEVDAWGNPSDRRFVVRVQALQQMVAAGLTDAFGERFARIERVETVGPRVGQQLRDDGIQAVLLSLALVLLYIGIRFDLRYAPAAVVALAHDVLITLGIFVIVQAEINLPIIAAMLTIVGYSLNDTIINFDRVRENIQLAGGSKFDLWALTNRSVNEVLSRTLLTAGTTLLAVGVIWIFGGGLIRTFALAMFCGVTIGTYSSIYIANPLMVVTAQWLEARAAERKQAATVVG